jgi:hypothetical protein
VTNTDSPNDVTAPGPPAARTFLMFVVAAPAIASTLLVALFVGSELAGQTPFGYAARAFSIRPDNLAEAAAMGNGGDALRFLWYGEDPTRVQSIRRDIISSVITRVTALEAAIFVRKLEIVHLLDRRGVIVGDEARRALACLAADLEVEDIRDYLRRETDPPCEPGAARARLLARSMSYGMP